MRTRLINASINGFTLIELLITLSILAILVTLAIPSYNELIRKSQATSAINHISRLTRLARNVAVSKGTTSTLCPTLNGQKCDGIWQDGVMLFTDHNKNAVLDGNDNLIQLVRPFIEFGELSWNSRQNFIQFSPRGLPRGTIGSFVFCPSDKNERHAKSLILSFQGRLRRGKDLNEDGIEETGNHMNILCTNSG